MEGYYEECILYRPVFDSRDTDLLYDINGIIKLIRVNKYLQKQMQLTPDWKVSVNYLSAVQTVRAILETALTSLSVR